MIAWSAIIASSESESQAAIESSPASVYLAPSAISKARVTLIEIIREGMIPFKFGFADPRPGQRPTED